MVVKSIVISTAKNDKRVSGGFKGVFALNGVLLMLF